MTVEGTECNVTIACAPYCRRLSMSTGKHGKTFGGRDCLCVCTCAHMQKGYAVRVIGLESTSFKLNSRSF